MCVANGQVNGLLCNTNPRNQRYYHYSGENKCANFQHDISFQVDGDSTATHSAECTEEESPINRSEILLEVAIVKLTTANGMACTLNKHLVRTQHQLHLLIPKIAAFLMRS